jgi:4-diphosphocytidyl-2-C-methyl-D-erythritol kinase
VEHAVTLRLRLPAPAKINLFLHVTGRREDGYHLLESVFVLISLADTVTLTIRTDGVIRLLDPPEGLSESNDLACRAARALQIASGTRLGVDIELRKRIPQGAGLGGGSSDAASTLLALNRLWSLARSRDDLQDIAATLGADVPFFVFGQPALAQGIGQKLRAVTAPSMHLVVASPGVSVATSDVFTHPCLTRNTPTLHTPVFTLGFGHNDLQPVAATLAPEIQRLQHAFLHAGAAPKMTGSGSCVFALAHCLNDALRLQAALTQTGWRAWAVRTLARHPLYGLADSATI